MKTKQAHVGKMEKQLKKWGAQLDQFVAKAGETGNEIKADYLKHIADLKLKHTAARIPEVDASVFSGALAQPAAKAAAASDVIAILNTFLIRNSFCVVPILFDHSRVYCPCGCSP